MKEIRFRENGKVYQVPTAYAEMNERQFRTAMSRLMRLADRDNFWYAFAGIPRDICRCLPEWMHLELSNTVEYITEMDDKLERFIITRLPVLGTFRRSRLYAPEEKLGNVSLQQFMTADNYFSYYTVTQRETFIDLMCAALYLKENETFVVCDASERLVPLQERKEYIHKFVPTDVRFAVFVNWIFIKNWLTDAFPHLFQRGKKNKGKPKAYDWLPVFDSFVGDNVPFIQDYQRMPCMDAFRIIDGKIARQQNNK